MNLALFGGNKVIISPLRRYNSIGSEELQAATEVINSGNLSQFVGSWSPDFYGGPKVREFEERCCEYFGVRHAITVNSWTSGLIAAVGAIGISPGDEVIVPTWTMCASATAILHWGGIPIFADIERETYNIDIDSVRSCISPNTKAILAVDIFGHPCAISEITRFAADHGLKVITDTAQAPGSLSFGGKTGVASDIGGYSLNYHKHIHTGEGGILVTNSSDYAERLQLIRNHGEAVVENKGISKIDNIVGFNFRLGEIEAAIGIQQLMKLDRLVRSRQEAASTITRRLSGLPGINVVRVLDECTHSYYIYPICVDVEELGVSRKRIIEALEAEGLEGLTEGYANIHMLPMYQQKKAFGANGFPWTYEKSRKGINYNRGICPVAEKLHDETFIGFEMCLYELGKDDVALVCDVFEKVWSNMHKLRESQLLGH